MSTRVSLIYPFKDVAIHHIDGNPSNNALENLRLVNTRTSGHLTSENWREIEAWRRRQDIIDGLLEPQ